MIIQCSIGTVSTCLYMRSSWRMKTTAHVFFLHLLLWFPSCLHVIYPALYIYTVYTSVYECVQARHRRVDGGRREGGRVCIRAQFGFCSSDDDIQRSCGWYLFVRSITNSFIFVRDRLEVDVIFMGLIILWNTSLNEVFQTYLPGNNSRGFFRTGKVKELCKRAKKQKTTPGNDWDNRGIFMKRSYGNCNCKPHR